MEKAQEGYLQEKGEAIMPTRVIKTTMGAVRFDSGAIPVNSPVSPGVPTLQFNDSLNTWMATKSHNDSFALDNVGAIAQPGGVHFATSDYIDLRDLIEEQKGLDDIIVNVQRQQELPYAAICYNVSPVNAMYETLIISQEQMPINAIFGSNEVPQLQQLHSIGFQDLGILDTGTGLYDYVATRQNALVYVETRKYSLDASQQWSSPGQMGQMNGIPPGNPAVSETRWTSDFAMVQRTVRGNPDLIVGPGLHVIRVWSMWAADRSAQASVLDPATNAVATEYEFNTSRLYVEIPALQVNIIGNQRELTATEQAVWYSNILLGP